MLSKKVPNESFKIVYFNLVLELLRRKSYFVPKNGGICTSLPNVAPGSRGAEALNTAGGLPTP